MPNPIQLRKRILVIKGLIIMTTSPPPDRVSVSVSVKEKIQNPGARSQNKNILDSEFWLLDSATFGNAFTFLIVATVAAVVVALTIRERGFTAQSARA